MANLGLKITLSGWICQDVKMANTGILHSVNTVATFRCQFVSLFNWLIDNGFRVIFISGRRNNALDSTIANLEVRSL